VQSDLSTPHTCLHLSVRPGSVTGHVSHPSRSSSADAVALWRQGSFSSPAPIVVERYGLVDWRYLDEVAERP
jgi:hypothetical protein